MKTILFLKTPHTSSLSHWISTEIYAKVRLSSTQVQFLFDLGAVYLDGVRLLRDQACRQGQTLRLHTRPKRFDSSKIDWKSRILLETEDFLAVDKPSGIPTHPTLDNRIENQLYAFENLRGKKYFPVQRLDVDTSGVCVIGKTSGFQKSFHQLLKQETTKKYYLACCKLPPPMGQHIHYIKKLSRPPHLVHSEPAADFQQCRLEVVHVEPLGKSFKVQIRLFTGRTHQIRAQLAFLGTPVIGDNIYQNEDVRGPHLLHSQRLEFKYQNNDFCIEAPLPGHLQ